MRNLLMNNLKVLIVLAMTIVAASAQAASSVLRLNPSEMSTMKLDSIPPWPEGVVLKGSNEHAMNVVHKGEVVVTVYAAEPALINVSEPYPYDEFVMVLEGEVTLTSLAGDAQTYKVGESFLVPKGWQGTWDMPVKFREMIIVETKAWVAAEE